MGTHNHALDGVGIPLGEGAVLEGANMGMPAHGQFTKGHGTLGRRCGLLSNYFDLLLIVLSVPVFWENVLYFLYLSVMLDYCGILFK